MKVILSIKPFYVDKILSGEKKYELRKSIFKNDNVNKVMIYASSPVSKIIGEFEIEKIFHKNVKELWELIKNDAGVKRDFFDEYFFEKEKGYAIEIKNVKKYKKHIDIFEEFGIKAPQSFAYVKERRISTD